MSIGQKSIYKTQRIGPRRLGFAALDGIDKLIFAASVCPDRIQRYFDTRLSVAIGEL